MRPSILVPLLVMTAGCIEAPGTGVEPGSAEAGAPAPLGGFEDPFLRGSGHDHGDPEQHRLATPTMELLAHVDMASLGVPTPAFGEAELLGEDHVVVAALLNGFYVVDVSERAAPEAVSYTPDAGFIGDAKASDSGSFVFLGVQLAGFTGVHAYNVVVRERPFLAGAFPITGGCHMLAVHRDVLYCAPNDATVRIFRIVESPAAVALVPVGAYAPKGAPLAPVHAQPGGEEFTHDMTVMDDPLTGEPVMFVSFWDYGVRVVDVADPAAPVELGAWTGEGLGDAYEGNVHTAMASLVEGRRVIAVVPEYALTPSLTFLDATDYGNLTFLGAWTPKTAEELGEDSSRFSTHNFQFLGGRVYLAMYHAGVFVVDASSLAALEAPSALGYYLPAERGSSGSDALPFGGGPNTWDVVVKDGHVYASDIASGLYALHYSGDTLGDAALTSVA